MESHFLLVILLVNTLTGSTTDTSKSFSCLDMSKQMIDSMPLKETMQSVLVNRGENLILNCTCSNECNGQWSGPNTILVPNVGNSIPYTQGIDLNPRLDKSKYSVYGGYDSLTCNLQITNFLSDDDGVYKCQYVQRSVVHSDVYNVSARRSRSFVDMSTPNHVVMTSEPDICTLETKDFGSNSVTLYGFVCMLIGSLVGGGLIFSICFNIYCILKRKQNSRINPEFQSEVQYYEIGSIHNYSANISAVPNNMQEAAASVNRPVSQRTNSTISSFENTSSSQPYVQSLAYTLMDERVYESPYHVIDPENIETHLYGILRSNMYQNTIIFQNKITTKTAERDPWLIIYENTSVNDLK